MKCLTEGCMNKGGQNQPPEDDRRPPKPGGSMSPSQRIIAYVQSELDIAQSFCDNVKSWTGQCRDEKLEQYWVGRVHSYEIILKQITEVANRGH